MLAKAIVRAWGIQSSISVAFQAPKRNDYAVVSWQLFFVLSRKRPRGITLEMQVDSWILLSPSLGLHLFLPIPPSPNHHPILGHQHTPETVNMAHRPPHNPGSPKFQDRHLEPRSPTQRQTNLSDMLVYVRDLDNPSHRQRSKEAAYNAVTHTQWASTIYYTNGRDRDLWAGSPDALEFMKDYDRLVTTAKDLTQKVSWFERTFETQDHVDWISPAFRDMLGQANVQGRPKRALFQDVTQLVRNWTGVRFRNLDHCLNDDIVWRDIPNIHRHFGQHGSEQGNVLVHNSDIVMDAMLCRAPDFISGHQNADSQRMTALFQWLTRLPPDVALDIGKCVEARKPPNE